MGLNGPFHAAVTEEQVHAEMRAAGRAVGLKARETSLARVETNGRLAAAMRSDTGVSEHIDARAAWWSEKLRHEGVNPRLTERLVTSFVTAAYEASRATRY